MEEITSRTNPKVVAAARLLKTAERRREGRALLEGARLVADAAENGYPIETLFVTASALGKYEDYLRLPLKTAGQTYTVADHVAEKLAETASPQGVFAVVRTEKTLPPVDPKGFYVCADDLQNPENLGALARTAEAFGVTGLIVSGGADPYAGKSLRASMGALLRLPVYSETDAPAFLSSLREKGLSVFGAVLDPDAEDVRTINAAGGKVLVIGNEGAGIGADVKRVCDKKVIIPMTGRAESLNAAAAAAILIWEFVR